MGSESQREIVLSIFQMVLLIVALHNVSTQSKRFQMATPVSYVHQTIAWLIAGLYILLYNVNIVVYMHGAIQPPPPQYEVLNPPLR